MSKFHVIYAVPKHDDEWRLAGVFTKQEDALGFSAELEASGGYLGVARPQEVEMKVILDSLVEDRLRELAEPIRRLVASVPPVDGSAETSR